MLKSGAIFIFRCIKMPPPYNSLSTLSVVLKQAFNKLFSKSGALVCLKIATVFLYIACCYFFARFALTGLGDHFSSRKTLALTLFITLLCASKKSFYFLILPTSILVSIYSPIGFEYGSPDLQAVISLYSTDVAESIEFLSLISFSSYIKALSIILLPFIAYYIATFVNLKPWRNKTYVCLVIGTLVFLLRPTEFINRSITAVNDLESSISELEKYANKSSWGQSLSQTKNRDFVLVIGESARKDYFHIYGYPIRNTPFLDNVPGVFVDGLTAGGTYTIGSLRLMLTHGIQETWQPRYDFNFVDLAKSAGIDVTWISNQGYIGQYDTPISSIGHRANKSIFPNKGAYDKVNLSDFVLLKILSKELRNITNGGSRLFVLHTIGSHPDACSRLNDFPEQYKVQTQKLSYVACYVSTIKKTDLFLSRLYEQMKQHEAKTGRSFSILYFSDHGQVHRELDGKIYINNNYASKLHYDVPLIRIDSDATQREVLNSKKSGLLFTAGLANWLQIKNSQVPEYDLFDGVNDKTDFGLSEKIKQIKLSPDPAIDITNVLVKEH